MEIQFKSGYEKSLLSDFLFNQLLRIVLRMCTECASQISRKVLSVTAEKLFDIIKSCILDVEECGLFVHVISTDNYP